MVINTKQGGRGREAVWSNQCGNISARQVDTQTMKLESEMDRTRTAVLNPQVCMQAGTWPIRRSEIHVRWCISTARGNNTRLTINQMDYVYIECSLISQTNYPNRTGERRLTCMCKQRESEIERHQGRQCEHWQWHGGHCPCGL